MINRINLILRAKNITARQFAEEIGIQPSGMSHIMSGRNNPSLDFVTKVIRRYPEIDANWLLLGRGAMYTADAVANSAGQPDAALGAAAPDLFGSAYGADSDARVAADGAASVAAATAKDATATDDATLFDTPYEADRQGAAVSEPTPMMVDDVHDEPVGSTRVAEPSHYEPTYIAVPPQEGHRQSLSEGRRLVRMLLVYSDNTFCEYVPQR